MAQKIPEKLVKAKSRTVSQTVELIDVKVGDLTHLMGELAGKLSPIQTSEHAKEYDSIIQHQVALLMAVGEFKNKLENSN